MSTYQNQNQDPESQELSQTKSFGNYVYDYMSQYKNLICGSIITLFLYRIIIDVIILHLITHKISDDYQAVEFINEDNYVHTFPYVIAHRITIVDLVLKIVDLFIVLIILKLYFKNSNYTLIGDLEDSLNYKYLSIYFAISIILSIIVLIWRSMLLSPDWLCSETGLEGDCWMEYIMQNIHLKYAYQAMGLSIGADPFVYVFAFIIMIMTYWLIFVW